MFSSEAWLAKSGGFYNGVATQSLRFDKASSAYLTRTPSSTTNRRTWTLSFWFKKTEVFTSAGNYTNNLFSAASSDGSDNFFLLRFSNQNTGGADERLEYYNNDLGGSDYSEETTSSFRDVSSWYHFVVAFDTTQSTAGNRMKFYVNGVEQDTAQYYGQIPQNHETRINENHPHNLGRSMNSTSNFLNGYMAEVNFVDGTQYDASYFGETKNGVWIAKTPSVTYGTNGYRLQFKQTGTGTASASTIGADTSGNDNHWTSSGIVASDCDMPDSPENNFATLNSVDTRFRAELAEGNLHVKALDYSSGNWGHSICTFKIPSSGKWYIEGYGLNLAGSNQTSAIGIMDSNVVSTSPTTVNYSITTDEGFDGIRHQHSSSAVMKIYVDGVQSGSDISFSNQSAISALAIDVDNGYIYVGGNDGTGGTGSEITWRDYADGSTGSSNVDPTSGSSGTGGIARTFNNNDIILVQVGVSGDSSNKSQVHLNAGQDSSFAGNLTAQGNSDANGVGDFYYQVPDGYLALCTSNLPEPTISPNETTQADDYFNIVTYSGNNDATRTFDVGFVSDWSWFKATNQDGYGHQLYDSVRGVQKRLRSNDDSLEATNSEGVLDFDDNGLLKIGTDAFLNESGTTMVIWNWKAGGTAVTNTQGDIQTQVSANTDAGFSIITYSGSGTAGDTIGHGLNSAPTCIHWKRRNATGNWMAYFEVLGTGGYLNLDRTNGFDTGASPVNGVAPTNNVITLSSLGSINNSAGTYVCYAFHDVDGFSRFGGYTGNDNPDGNFIYLGFRPSFLIIKYASGSAGGTKNWFMFDDARDTFNPTDDTINANASDGETSDSNKDIDFLSNGFKIRNSEGAINNAAEYIYMAFAKTPFKYANAR